MVHLTQYLNSPLQARVSGSTLSAVLVNEGFLALGLAVGFVPRKGTPCKLGLSLAALTRAAHSERASTAEPGDEVQLFPSESSRLRAFCRPKF